MGLDSNLKYFSLLVASVYLHVTPQTLKRWVRAGQIDARRVLVSGRSYKLVISEKEIARYIDENWPTLHDLDHPPRSPRAARIQQIRNANRGYLGKAAAANAARRYGKLR